MNYRASTSRLSFWSFLYKNMNKFLARDNEKLKEHLENVAKLSSAFLKKFNAENIGYLIGILHDFGKYTDEFQDYLIRSLESKDTIRGEQIHAFQGAKFLNEEMRSLNSILKEILMNIIEAHHAGLYDGVEADKKPIFEKLEHNDLHYNDAKINFLNEFNEFKNNKCEKLSNLCNQEFKEIISKFSTNNDNKENFFFILHLFTKFLYSVLIDSDRYDAAGFDINYEIERYNNGHDWSILIEKLNRYLISFNSNNTYDINYVRRKISDQCYDFARNSNVGIYTLSVPTGAGKTLSSLRFALSHAQKNRQNKIIYIIPYLSIIDQTANVIKNVFNYNDNFDDYILEHHSNIEVEEEDIERSKLLTSRWDSPIIITTMVQFLESIFSNKPSKLRKFHNMSDSVIIFDEIQALPIKCINLFNMVVNFLSSYTNSTILLCTATNPQYERSKRPLKLMNNHELVFLNEADKNLFNRTNLVCDYKKRPLNNDEIINLIKIQLNSGKNTLVILNTRASAKDLYKKCKDDLCYDMYFLSTNLCPVHRLKIINRISNSLKNKSNSPILCISTQLVEAGVDLSFECVIRATAGIDSIIQAAGRCNRNSESNELQNVYVISVADEKLSKLEDIKLGKDVSERIIREYNYLVSIDNNTLTKYYEYFYSNYGIDKLDYQLPHDKKTIFNMLSINTIAINTYNQLNSENFWGIPCAFRTASQKFSVIEDAKVIAIIILYDEKAESLVREYNDKKYLPTQNKIALIKKMQKYSISVYKYEYDELCKNHALSVTEDGQFFYLSNKSFYDNNIGIVLSAKLEFIEL